MVRRRLLRNLSLERLSDMMNRRKTTLDELMNLLDGMGNSLRSTGAGKEVWDHAHSLAKWVNEHPSQHKPWIVRDYIDSHRAEKPLFELEGEIEQVATFMARLTGLTERWATLQ